MFHVFRATRLGWNREREGIFFDSKVFSREQAEAHFIPYHGITQDGFPYTGYEYDGIKYYDVKYLGEFSKNTIPRSDEDYIAYLLNKPK